MSLDVYLNLKGAVLLSATAIFFRENGQNKQISQEEWNQRFPEHEPVICDVEESDEVYSANITHNLIEMAEAAGVYKHIWQPDKTGVELAHQLIEPLEQGLETLKKDPNLFQRYNPENGWGNYEGLVKFVENYLNACKQYPGAEVSVWR